MEKTNKAKTRLFEKIINCDITLASLTRKKKEEKNYEYQIGNRDYLYLPDGY